MAPSVPPRPVATPVIHLLDRNWRDCSEPPGCIVISRNPGLQTKTQGQETGGEKRMEATSLHTEKPSGEIHKQNPPKGKTRHGEGQPTGLET